MNGPAYLLERARWVLIPILLAAAVYYFGSFVHDFYPFREWLFWRYAGYWLGCAFWSAACVSAGHLTITRVLRRHLPILEHLVTSFAVGAFEFFLAMNVAGALQLYHPATFFALPLLMLGAGLMPLQRYLTRVVRHLRGARRRAPPAPVWTWAVLAYGLIGVGMVYFLILTPENIQFDSRWKHLALAEDYAAHGGIRRFPEGYTVATYPHLATFIYGWAFLLPRGLLFDKVELAAHMEFFGFLWTLAAIPAALRLMLPPRYRPRCLHLAWTARFLFPGVFLYDSSLSGGADHIAAIFALPTFTLLVRAWKELSPRYMALLLMTMAGGGLTKYTGAIIMVPYPALAIGIRALILGYRSLRGQVPHAIRRNWYLGPLAAVGFGLLYTSPHWLKNLIYYTDPLYPTLYKYIASRPWTPDAADLYEWGYKDHQFWRPPRTLVGVKETVRALFNFSFVPNDYKTYHGTVPIFGSLFTLLLPCALFLRGTRRVWALMGYAYLGIGAWYWTHHQDRYLQAIVPLLAATTAAIIALLWRAFREDGRGARIASLATRAVLMGLIGLQIVWGGDAYFIPTHAMIRSPQKAVLDLLAMGHKRKYRERFQIYQQFQSMRQAMPRGSRVLLHDNHVHLGIGVESVSDWGGWQFGISYGRMSSPRAVYDMLREMGVTHVAWESELSKGWDSVAGDLVFFSFALNHTKNRSRHGRMVLAELGPPPVEDRFPAGVAWLGCNDDYRNGLYELSEMTVPVFGPKRRALPKPRMADASAEELIGAASFVVVDGRCQRSLPPTFRTEFTLAAKRKEPLGKRPVRELYLRTGNTPGQQPPAPAPASAPPDPTPTPGEPGPAPGMDDETPGEERD